MLLTAKEVAKRGGMLSVDEVDLIHRATKTLRAGMPSAVVNIGSGEGTSTLALLEAEPSLKVWSIDKKSHRKELAVIQQSPFKTHERNICILDDSARAGRIWSWPISLVFIDGDHTNAGCKADIDAWVRHVEIGGVIFFHDYDHPRLPKLKTMIDREMGGNRVIGKARYLIAFEKLT